MHLLYVLLVLVMGSQTMSLHSLLNYIFVPDFLLNFYILTSLNFCVEETHCRIIENVPKGGFNAKIKSHASKVSTLMKPTASYLAKKTQRYEPASLIKYVIYH